MAFYEMVEREFGPEAKSALKRYNNLNRKCVLAKSRKWYLLTCESEGLFPKYLTKGNIDFPDNYQPGHRSGRLSAYSQQRLDGRNKKLLEHGIQSTVKSIEEIESEMDRLVTWIDAHLPEELCADYFTRQKLFAEKFSESKTEELAGKRNRLIKKRRKNDRSESYKMAARAECSERSAGSSSTSPFFASKDSSNSRLSELPTHYTHLSSKSHYPRQGSSRLPERET